MKTAAGLALVWMLLCSVPAMAGKADVVGVKVLYQGQNLFVFSVTVAHHDTGWKHFADKWDVIAPDGSVLATRILHHPHEDEQPFTRRLQNVKIAPGVKHVTIRAHDSVHGYGGKEMDVKLPR